MNNILILTVGGSHQPTLRSLEQNRPDFAHFLCSGDSEGTKGSYRQVIGEGRVLKSDASIAKPDLPNITRLAGLRAEQYAVHRIQYYDNLNHCYLTAAQLIESVRAEFPHARLTVDYTGGTKSMTAGLAVAALDDGRCEIQMVAGRRQDLKQVVEHTEFVRPTRVWDAQARRQMQAARALLERFDYVGAARLLEETARRFAGDETLETLQRWLSLCRGFDAWDKFNHANARQFIAPYRGRFLQHYRFLEAIVGEQGHGFEMVEDLLMNAERRAAQGRYDDAVGRLYRALELGAQVWLKQKYGIETGRVDSNLIPEPLRVAYQRLEEPGRGIRLGLMQAWDLLAAMPGDPVGEYFKPHRSRLLNFLSLRNQSLFAHGFSPIGEEDYRGQSAAVLAFLRGAVDTALAATKKQAAATITQLPNRWD